VSSNSYTVEELAGRLDAKVYGDAKTVVSRIAPLESAGPGDLTFYSPTQRRGLREVAERLRSSRALAVIVAAPLAELTLTQISVPHPLRAVASLAELFKPAPRLDHGVHPTAVVSSSAQLGAQVAIGAFAVIGEDVQIGDRTVVHPHVVVYAGVKIGKSCVIHSGAVIREYVELGDDCLIQNGVVLGGDGFGYFSDKEEGHARIPHIGNVVLEDRVDIGANSTVDRAMLGTTRIGRSSKIDNIVMIGHNTKIGERTLVCGHTGISGSCDIGSDVILAGGVGVADHVRIGDNVRAAARAGITGDIEANRVVAGHPPVDVGLWRRQVMALRKLPGLLRELRQGSPLGTAKESGESIDDELSTEN